MQQFSNDRVPDIFRVEGVSKSVYSEVDVKRGKDEQSSVSVAISNWPSGGMADALDSKSSG